MTIFAMYRLAYRFKWALILSLLGFTTCIVISYPLAQYFSLAIQIAAHILTIIFAGIFKAAAVALMAVTRELNKGMA